MYIRRIFLISLSSVLFLHGCNDNLNEQTSSEIIDYHYDVNSENTLEQAESNYQQIITEVESIDVLNLKQALALTLIHNPQLKAYSLEIRAAEAHQLQESLKPNPELEVEVEEIGDSGDRSGFDAAETTIQLSQTIELGNKSQKREKVASLEKELIQLNYELKKLEIFSETIRAFLNILSAQEKVRLSDELLKLSVESFESVEKRVDAGKDSPLEKTRASIALLNIKSDNQQAHLELEYSRKKLASFWSQNQLPFEQVDGDLEIIEQLASFEDLTNQLKQNPEYMLWEIEVKKSQAKLSLEKSKSIVDLTIGAGVQNFNETDENAFVFGFSIPLPIANRNQGARQEATFNLAQKKELQKAAWLKLQNEFNETYKEFTKSYNRAVSMKNEILPAAIELFDSATTAYHEGKIDYLNMLDAQRTLFNVQNEYIESLITYHIAKTDIEKLTNNQSLTIENRESGR
ncbi:MAG: TolC family protein [Sedimentisphaerales bacterium]|nr:TolC family protein [Sedimentisphaerales bacterium]